MTPIATMANLTATGDVVLGPGGLFHLAFGLPVACMGDLVAGPLCVSGVVTLSTALTHLVLGRPLANMGSMVTGITPLGTPIATAVMVCPCVFHIV